MSKKIAAAQERIEVKTKAAAEKAIKAGKPVNIIAGAFALTLNTNVSVWVSGSACPALTLGTSAPSIVTLGTSAPSIVTLGTSAPSIVTRETSAPRIVTRGTSAPSIETLGTSAPSIETRETSAPRIVTRGTSAPSIETWETSAPSIETWGTSAPSIETWGTSAPSIVTWETSAPSIDAHGWSMIQVRAVSEKLTGTAADTVCLNIRGKVSIKGGRQQVVKLETPVDWCNYYGVRVEDGCAIVYKAVGENYVSARGVTYAPGSTPSDPKWDGRKRECEVGGGLNFSPTPRHCHEFVSNPKHYLECRVKLDELVVHWDGPYPQKVCAREVAAPLVEVDIDGKPIDRATLAG